MKKWFDIIEPHEDIKKGDFTEAVFAADLEDVASGNAPEVYNDPYLFMKKTYLTDGLKSLLFKVYRKLIKGEGDSIVEIQTPFGGGKTHSLVTIYHYLKNGEEIKDQLPNDLSIFSPEIGVFVGTHLNPLKGKNDGDITRYTLWGELGYQLGGKEGYKYFAENDKNRVSPGKANLKDFLSDKQPFILLYDEIMEYINRARDVSTGETSLGSQTYAFFQEITETVASLPKGMMLATLPSSTLENFTEDTEQSFARIRKIFGRLETITTPVRGEEVYSIIQKRLFEEVKDNSAKKEVIHNYAEKYRRHKSDLPNYVKNKEFKRKMEISYPFHPDVIDILYQKWGTFHTFQRTRGVLRLLANVIEDLYQKERAIDLILPSDISLNNSSIRSEFIDHIGQQYQGVISSDISNHSSKAKQLDKENKDWGHLAERISTSVFLHSFSGGREEIGVDNPTIKLNVLRPDTFPAMVTEVLNVLKNELWYLNTRNGDYYFSNVPNLNRVIIDRKDMIDEKNVEKKLREIIQEEIGSKIFKSYIWPGKSENIPDDKNLKLVISSPKANEDKLLEDMKEMKGENFRTYKNTIVFAICNEDGYVEIRDKIKSYLALKEIKKDIETGSLENLKESKSEVGDRLRNIEDDFNYYVRYMYNTLLVNDDVIKFGQPHSGSETLTNWFSTRLESEEKIVKRISSRFLENKFFANNDNDYISTKEILEQFYKDVALPMITNKEVITNALEDSVENGYFGIGYWDEKEDQIDEKKVKYNEKVRVALDEEEYLLKGRYAEELKAKFKKDKISSKDDEEDESEVEVEPESEKGTEEAEDKDENEDKKEKIYKGTLELKKLSSENIADINRSFLRPLVNYHDNLEFSMEIKLDSEEGVPEEVIKDEMEESAKQLGIELDIKEEN